MFTVARDLFSDLGAGEKQKEFENRDLDADGHPIITDSADSTVDVDSRYWDDTIVKEDILALILLS